MKWSRRDFLGTGLLSAASLPFFGCSTSRKELTTPVSQTLPSDSSNDYFYNNFGITQSKVDQVLARALSRGGTFGELYFEHTRDGYVQLMDGIVSEAIATVALGMGVRCVNDDQVGYAFSESLELEDMLRAADAAAAIAPGVNAKELTPRQQLEFKKRYDTQYNWDNLDVTRAISLLRDIERKLKEKDSDIIKIIVAIQWLQKTIMVNTSDGVNATDNQPSYVIYAQVVMQRGDNRQSNGCSLSHMSSFDQISEDEINQMVEDAYQNTKILFDAIKPKGGDIPVVLSAGDSGILLHEAIGHGLEADFNRKETSIYSTKLGQKIASEEVSIFDTSTFDSWRGAVNIDDEGTPTQNTVLVENGTLVSYMHDKISAKHFGVTPTGSGRRQSYKFAPIPRMRVTCMENGKHSFDDLLNGIDYGIMCYKFTNGQVSIGAGDYTFYVKNGYLIENGKLSTPIKDVNIIGNGPDTLAKIELVANDFKLLNGGGYCGKNGQMVPVSFGMPSVRVSSINVGGE